MRIALRTLAATALLAGAVVPSPASAAFTGAARHDGSTASAATVFTPRNTVAPSVPGTPRDNVAVTASAGTWDRQPTSYTYQWQRCDSSGASCADIASATSLTYTPGAADVGGTLRIAVTAVNAGGPTTATSPASAVVVAGVPRGTGAPTISGNATTGSTLTATTGTWTGAATITYAYQWQRCTAAMACTNVAGATGSTYLVTSTDSRNTLRVVVTATNTYGSATQTSTVTATVDWEVKFVAATSSGSTTRRTTMTVTKPAGVMTGDLIIAVLAATAPTTFSAAAPAGWTQLTTGGSGAASVWTRTATATEPNTYTFNSTASEWMAMTLSAYRNADTTAGAVTFATTPVQTSGATTFPTFTTAPGAMRVAGLVNAIATTRGTVTHTNQTARATGYSETTTAGQTSRVEVVAVDRQSPWGSAETWTGWGSRGTIALRVPAKP